MSVRFCHARLPEPRLCGLVEDVVVPLDGTLDALIAAGEGAWEAAAEDAERRVGEGLPLAEVELAAPLVRPSKVVCIGLNYHDHAREAGTEPPDRPLVFAKFPSAITGPADPVSWPAGLTEQVDWEVELAAIVGTRLRHASADEALAGVFGYTAANDLSARDLQFSDGQWVRGKTLDGFCPLGPSVVRPDDLGDPGALRLTSTVNGEVMQDSSTAEMIFGVGEILSFLSVSFTLEPGDLVLTGTPWGVGAFRDPPVFLQPGDTVEVEVERIGKITTPIAAEGN